MGLGARRAPGADAGIHLPAGLWLSAELRDTGQLIFGSKKDGAADKAIFRVYLKALHEVGFHDAARSKDKIVSAVAEFLFGDKEALKGAL